MIDLPGAIRGFTMLDLDGNYNVYISARLSTPGQKRALDHEIRHIKRGDYDRTNVEEIEAAAHAMDKKG